MDDNTLSIEPKVRSLSIPFSSYEPSVFVVPVEIVLVHFLLGTNGDKQDDCSNNTPKSKTHCSNSTFGSVVSRVWFVFVSQAAASETCFWKPCGLKSGSYGWDHAHNTATHFSEAGGSGWWRDLGIGSPSREAFLHETIVPMRGCTEIPRSGQWVWPLSTSLR